jgi:hypothetical protein
MNDLSAFCPEGRTVMLSDPRLNLTPFAMRVVRHLLDSSLSWREIAEVFSLPTSAPDPRCVSAASNGTSPISADDGRRTPSLSDRGADLARAPRNGAGRLVR